MNVDAVASVTSQDAGESLTQKDQHWDICESTIVVRRSCLRGQINPLKLNDLQRRHAVSPLKIKILSNKSRQVAFHGGI
jgi:hypothetical protein